MRDKIATESFLRDQKITYSGSRYQPLLHGEIIDGIREQLYKNSFTITSESYLASQGGQRVIGKFGVKYCDELDYMIAFGNSLDGSMAFKLSTGSIVRVCSNGCIFGESNLKKKHILGKSSILLMEYTIDAINQIEEVMKSHLAIKTKFDNIEIDAKTRATLIGDMFLNEGVIQSTQLGIIKKEIENPSFTYGNPDSLWSLYNHCTLSAKQQTPLHWQKQHEELGDYFVTASGTLMSKSDVSEEMEYILEEGVLREV